MLLLYMLLQVAKVIAFGIAMSAIAGTGVGIQYVLKFLITVFFSGLTNLLTNCVLFDVGVMVNILFVSFDIIINSLGDGFSFVVLNMSSSNLNGNPSGNPTGPLDKIFWFIIYYSYKLWVMLIVMFDVLYDLICFVVYGTFLTCCGLLFYVVPLMALFWLLIYVVLEEEYKEGYRQVTIELRDDIWQAMKFYYNKLRDLLKYINK